MPAPQPESKTRWVSPSLQVKWGPYFKADPAEQKVIVDMARSLLGGDSDMGGSKDALVTKRTAVEMIAAIAGIENIDAALEALEKEQVERDEKSMQKQVDTQRAMHDAVGEGAGGAGAPKPTKAPGGGSVGKPPAAQAKK